MANLSTPLGVDQYSRFMVNKMDDREIIGVPTAAQAFFGNPINGGLTLFSPDANIVEIDILRGNKRLAQLVHRNVNSRPISGQKNTANEKFSSISRQYPLIEEEDDINAGTLLLRVAGEKPYKTMTRLDRLRKKGMDGHMEHIRRIVRLFEVLAWQSLLEGTQDAIFGTTNTDWIYDFYRRSTHIITVSTKWDAPGDPIGDIDDGCELVQANGHVTPDMGILGGGAMDAFIKDTTVAAFADNRRFELINIGTDNPVPKKYMRFVDSGLTPRGRLRTPKGYTLWLFTYVDTYTNAAGASTKYMPDASMLIASSQARCDRYFGPPEVLPMIPQRAAWYQQVYGFNPEAAPMPPDIKNMSNIINPAMFYFDAYGAQNWKSVTARTQAAPIFATHMTDGFVTLNGIV